MSGERLAKAAVAAAAEAQPAWAAVNPQRRARVLMEFVRLLNRDMDKLAENDAYAVLATPSGSKPAWMSS